MVTTWNKQYCDHDMVASLWTFFFFCSSCQTTPNFILLSTKGQLRLPYPQGVCVHQIFFLPLLGDMLVIYISESQWLWLCMTQWKLYLEWNDVLNWCCTEVYVCVSSVHLQFTTFWTWEPPFNHITVNYSQSGLKNHLDKPPLLNSNTLNGFHWVAIPTLIPQKTAAIDFDLNEKIGSGLRIQPNDKVLTFLWPGWPGNNKSVSMLLTTVLLMYIYTACWLNNYVVQLCPFWCNSYGDRARLSRLLTESFQMRKSMDVEQISCPMTLQLQKLQVGKIVNNGWKGK